MRITVLAAMVFGSFMLPAQSAQARSLCTVRAGGAKVTGAPEIDPGRVHLISTGSSDHGTRPANITVFGQVEGAPAGTMDLKSRWGGRWSERGKPFIVTSRRNQGEDGPAIQYRFSQDEKTVEITVGEEVDASSGERRLAKKVGTAKADCHEEAPTGLDRSYSQLQARYFAFDAAENCFAYPTDDIKRQFAALAADASLTPAIRAEKLTPSLCVNQVEDFNRLNSELAKVGWDLKGDMRGNAYRVLLQAFEAQAAKAAK